MTSSADSDTAWHNSAVTVTLSPADTGGSGVADTQYRLHGSSTWLEATGNAFVVPAPLGRLQTTAPMSTTTRPWTALATPARPAPAP